MSKLCIYCKTNVDDSSVIDFCRPCGIGVWGEKMFKTIVQNMENARDAGDLYQGSVSNSQDSSSDKTVQKSPTRVDENQIKNIQDNSNNNPLTSIAEDAMRSSEEIEKLRGDSFQ
jgi:hypothetical protein